MHAGGGHGSCRGATSSASHDRVDSPRGRRSPSSRGRRWVPGTGFEPRWEDRCPLPSRRLSTDDHGLASPRARGHPEPHRCVHHPEQEAVLGVHRRRAESCAVFLVDFDEAPTEQQPKDSPLHPAQHRDHILVSRSQTNEAGRWTIPAAYCLAACVGWTTAAARKAEGGSGWPARFGHGDPTVRVRAQPERALPRARVRGGLGPVGRSRRGAPDITEIVERLLAE